MRPVILCLFFSHLNHLNLPFGGNTTNGGVIDIAAIGTYGATIITNRTFIDTTTLSACTSSVVPAIEHTDPDSLFKFIIWLN